MDNFTLAQAAREKAARASTVAECDYALSDIGAAIVALSGGPGETMPSPYIVKLLEERDAYIARRELLTAKPGRKLAHAEELYDAVEALERLTDGKGQNIYLARPIEYAKAWQKVRRAMRRIDGEG